MKKIFNLFLVLVLVFVFTGCGETEKATEKTQDETQTMTETQAMRDPRADVIVKNGTDEELMAKYGPADMTEEEIKQLVSSINWETNENVSNIGSKYAKQGGLLRLGRPSYPPTMRTEGKNSNESQISDMAALVLGTMITTDTITLETAPSLADKWSVSDDKMTYYFHIDPLAKWHDGHAVTAYDYVATFDLVTHDDLEDPMSQLQKLQKFERPVALSKDVLMVKAKEKEWILFLQAGAMTVLPEHIIGRMTAKEYMKEYETKFMLGCGPYTVEKAATNQEIILKKVDNWWAKDKPYNKYQYNFDRIKYTFYSEQSLLLEKFKKGELDLYLVGVARRWHQELTADHEEKIKLNHIVRQRVYNKAPQGLAGFFFNIREYPFDDKNTRKALMHLFNREKMMETLFFNEYTYSKSYFPNSPNENPDNEMIEYNPEKAIQLLEEAGWYQDSINSDGYMEDLDGNVFEFDLPATGEDTRIETVLQEELKAVGIKMNVKKTTWATLVKDLNERNFRITQLGFTGSLFPYPEMMYHSKYADKPNTNNVWGFKNKRADEIIEKYNSEFDIKERIKMMQELDSIFTSEYMTMLRWYSNNSRLLYWNMFGTPDSVISKYGDYDNSAIQYWWIDEQKTKELEKAKADNTKMAPRPAVVKYWENK